MSSGDFTRTATASVVALLVLTSGLTVAQTQSPAPAPTPAAAAQRETAAAERLPVRRVVLYKSGVGYFEHLGRVRGDQNVTIDFTSGQLDDVLKSLTALDLNGGRIAGVSYNSEASLDRRLGELRLPVGSETTRAAFLAALRGARIEVRTGAARLTGRLLSVERIDRKVDNAVTHVDALSIVSDAGEIHTIALDAGVSVRILEADLNQEVGRYLSLVGSVRDQDVRRLTLATTGTGDRDLFVSYVSEVPVWKATYRLVLPSAGETRKPLLQGWAIVDNTVGQDWERVELSLVAGAPQSFVQAISQPYYVQRPVIPLPDRVQLTPQTHQAALGTAGAGAMTGVVTDSGGGVVPGATVRVTRGGAMVGQAVTDANGHYRLDTIAPGQYDVNFSLAGFSPVSRSGIAVTGGMETVLNATLQVGGMSESVSVAAASPARSSTVGRGGGRGGTVGGVAQSTLNTTRDGVSMRADAVSEVTVSAARAAFQAEATAAQLGDLFEYKLKEPVTIRKNQSALVPILGGEVNAEKVSLWNLGSGLNRPLRAVWVTNSTGLTLDGGSFSVIEGQAFAGEGLIEPLKAGERRLLSYAVDLGVHMDSKGESVPSRVTRVQLNRGLVIQTTEEQQSRTYSARNEDSEARVVVIEHPARVGWTLGGTIKPAETTAAWHRFRVTVEPKTTATFTVEETHPVQTQIAVSSITDDHVALWVRTKAISPATESALREVIARKAEIARLNGQIAARQAQIEEINRDQQRIRENMKSLKGTSEERALLQRYVKQLDDQENRLETLRKEVQTLTAERQRLDAELAKYVESIST